MALQVKYTDENGILHINMSPPSSSPRLNDKRTTKRDTARADNKSDIDYPNFDTINKRFSHYDIFGGKYDVQYDDSGGVGVGVAGGGGGVAGRGEAAETRSLFRSRYNSIEEELANTPYAFATERSFQTSTVRLNDNPILDITIESGLKNESPSKDLEDDRFFSRDRELNFQNEDNLFGSQVDFEVLSKASAKADSPEEPPAFCVTQLIHAQDRYFDLSKASSSRTGTRPSSRTISPSRGARSEVQVDTVKAEPRGVRVKGDIGRKGVPGGRTVRIVEGVRGVGGGAEEGGGEAFRVLPAPAQAAERAARAAETILPAAPVTVIPTAKRKRESSFAIIPEPPVSRPTSPASLPLELRTGRISPFRGRGFREETSRHATPDASKVNTPRTSRSNSPSRRINPLRHRTSSLSRLDMTQVATMPPTINLSRPHSPRNYIKENIEGVRELSQFNREKNVAEAEQKRREEEEALLIEMGLIDKNANIEATKSSRSRSNSPSKIKLRSRSNSPSAILHFEKIPEHSKDFVNPDDGIRKPVVHASRLRSISRSQPQSNNGSPKHSKIPKRQNSVSPTRPDSNSPAKSFGTLNKNQRFISNSTSSIQESIRIGRTASDQRKGMSKSNQHLNISPSILKSKPPISPGKAGPPPTNRSVNSKRLSPIVGTPNKSPTEDVFSKPASARTSPKVGLGNKLPKKPIKTAGNTPATSRFASKTNSRVTSRDPSPEKRRNIVLKSSNVSTRNAKADGKTTITKTSTLKRTPSSSNVSKPSLQAKPDLKKTVSRVNSIRNLTRTNSTRTLTDKQESMKSKDAKIDEKDKSTSKRDITNIKDGKTNAESNSYKSEKDKTELSNKANGEMGTDTVDEKIKQDNETQYEKTTAKENEEHHLIPLTKMSVVSMTTAAITAQPLDVVTKVTNQLPNALEKAREKAMFERLGSNDSILGKNDENEQKEGTLEKKSSKSSLISIKEGDNIKMKPLQPPFNNPQVEKAKQKIDDILKNPEVSTENILNPIQRDVKSVKETMKTIASTSKAEVKHVVTEIKDDSKIGNIPEVKDYILKHTQKPTDDIRTEATKIIDSIMTPVEEPIKEKAKEEIKKTIEPVVMIVNEKPKPKPEPIEVMERMTEALIKGDPEVEVQSSNDEAPHVEKMAAQTKVADGAGSDKSSYSNGGLPKSTSTTPRPVPPARAHKPASSKPAHPADERGSHQPDQADPEGKRNICQRLMGKCATRCSCCGSGKKEEGKDMRRSAAELGAAAAAGAAAGGGKGMSSLNCCRKAEEAGDAEKTERGAGKANTIEFENETAQRKRGLADALCCRARRHRVRDSSGGDAARAGAAGAAAGAAAASAGCCGRLACWRRGRSQEDWATRRDSILSDKPPRTWCNNRACNWLCAVCCRRARAQPPSRRTSMFSKNKSLSPTLPAEDTRTKLDTSLVEHTSAMRGAIPVLPIALAYFCLVCNVFVPGLGTVFSGMLCLCFGIPRFGIHDGIKPRIGSFLINTLVGAAQLFTVLFCLVGWGWSIWWGSIMLRVARKYRKLRETAAADEERAAPPVTTNNHTAAP